MSQPPTQPPTPPLANAQPVLVLCRDLLFTSKITGVAKAINAQVKLLRDTASVETAPASARMIVDLTQEGFLQAAAGWKSRTGGHVVGFVGHTETELIARARELGIDQVLAKGAFVNNLEQILRT